MAFDSIEFIVFFTSIVCLYWLLGIRYRAQNALILVASYFFYGWWDWRFLVLIAGSSLLDFIIGKKLSGSAGATAKRKRLVALSVTANLCLLGVFKYYNFFIESLSQLLQVAGIENGLDTLPIVLPVGISFYTFQSMAYTIDVYRGKVTAEANLVTFLAYISFFPQLVAGPIERADRLLPQFHKARELTDDLVKMSVLSMSYGFLLKILVSNTCSGFVSIGFHENNTNGWSSILAVLFFSIQIYADFYAYSLIAKGAAGLLGIELIDNFRQPYFAANPSDFWRRWHVSLSTWLRDYLYIPLGGNRGSKSLLVRNLMVTMILGGLWHGASWNFIWWGVGHGLILVLYHLALSERWKTNVSVVRQIILRSATLFWILVSWWLFRAQGESIVALASRQFSDFTLLEFHTRFIVTFLCLLTLVLTVDAFIELDRKQRMRRWLREPIVFSTTLAVLWLISISMFQAFETQFIYFQF